MTHVIVVRSEPIIIILSNETTGTTYCNYSAPTVTVSPWITNVSPWITDESFYSAAYYRPARPRRGAYVALLPLTFDPALEAPLNSAPHVVRQDGWRLAVHTRRVTTSL